MSSIWIVEVKTESGDDYGAHMFTREPTRDELEQFLRQFEPDEEFPGDDQDGCPGFRGSNYHITCYEGGCVMDPSDL